MNGFAPAFRLAPHVRCRIDRVRLYFDLVGVTLVRLFLPLVQSPLGHTVLGIYNIAAWVTILTLDSTRIPEAVATRRMQRQAWRYAINWIPLLAATCLLMTFGFHQTLMPQALSVGKVTSLIIGCYVDELLFRNTLQPKLRQWGIPKWAAIGTQSTLYACAIWIGHAPLPVVCAFWLLGWANGWIVYKFRSLWPALAFGFIWNVLWFA